MLKGEQDKINDKTIKRKGDSLKYFCIGYPKTGTSTLEKCFQILNYNTIKIWDYFIEWYKNNEDITNILHDVYFKKIVRENDFFSDWPFFLMYKDLDINYPNSKFILTIRKSNTIWEASLKKHIKRGSKKKDGRRQLWANLNNYYNYNYHIQCIRTYFKDRPDDLLVLCFDNNDEWKKLCSFLKQPIPNQPFPHENKAPDMGLKGKLIKKYHCFAERFKNKFR